MTIMGTWETVEWVGFVLAFAPLVLQGVILIKHVRNRRRERELNDRPASGVCHGRGDDRDRFGDMDGLDTERHRQTRHIGGYLSVDNDPDYPLAERTSRHRSERAGKAGRRSSTGIATRSD